MIAADGHGDGGVGETAEITFRDAELAVEQVPQLSVRRHVSVGLDCRQVDRCVAGIVRNGDQVELGGCSDNRYR